MPEEKSIALVSTTMDAALPMTAYLREHAPEYRLIHYLDGGLMDKVKREGGIHADSTRRFSSMIADAFTDGADGVIMTCTIFSPWAEAFTQIFHKPVVPADIAMLDRVSRCPGRTAILCTFEGTVETSRRSYLKYRRKNHMPEEVDIYPLPDAFREVRAGHIDIGNQIIADRIRELDPNYEQIVLAQISMSGAASLVKTKHARLFSSPPEALREMRERLMEENGG